MTKKHLTLQLKRPFGKAIVLAISILIVLCGLAEILARNSLVKSRLPAPSIGTGHKNLDLKLSRLDDFVKKNGHVDCIFLGASPVHRGINPEVFNKIYQVRTAKKIRSFNFGVGGLNIPAAAMLSEIFKKLYQPTLLIIGVMPDTEERGKRIERLIHVNPWINYHLGKPSLDGWLTDNSYAYKYYLRFRFWMEQPDHSAEIKKQESRISPSGYGAYYGKGRRFNLRRQPRVTHRLSNPGGVGIPQSHLTELQKMLKIYRQATIVIVENPVHPTFISQFGENGEVYQKFIDKINACAKRHGVLFFPTTHLNLIPYEGWQNRNHMNVTGASVFSRWLGKTVGDAVNHGLIPNPTRQNR